MGIEDLPILKEPLKFPIEIVECAFVKFYPQVRMSDQRFWFFGKILRNNNTFLLFDNSFIKNNDGKIVSVDSSRYREIDSVYIEKYQTVEKF